MAITSIGYAGQITAANWPAFSWNLLAGYTIGSATDLKVTATSGDRTVAISNGVAVGAGVMDTCIKALKNFETIGCKVESVQPDFPMEKLWNTWL